MCCTLYTQHTTYNTHLIITHVQGTKHRNKTEFLREKNSYNSFLIPLPAVSIESNWICFWRRGFGKLSSTLSHYYFWIAITIHLECDNNVKIGFHSNTCSIDRLSKYRKTKHPIENKMVIFHSEYRQCRVSKIYTKTGKTIDEDTKVIIIIMNSIVALLIDLIQLKK